MILEIIILVRGTYTSTPPHKRHGWNTISVYIKYLINYTYIKMLVPPNILCLTNMIVVAMFLANLPEMSTDFVEIMK